jgi:hypothetical protein
VELGRKEKGTTNELKNLGYTFNERATDKAHFYQGDTEESK